MLNALLKNYTPFDAEEAVIKKQLEQFLASTDNAYGRDNLTAHVAADAWIVNPARSHVLLVEHGENKHWMAPGGHCDNSPDVMGAARREALEEAGVDDLKILNNGQLYDIHSGTVPMRMKSFGLEPAHLHFDICFAFEADDAKPLTISDESTGLKWVALADIGSIAYWPGHMRRIAKMKTL